MPMPTVDPETGLTSCHNAYSSISMDDGCEYCKVCYEEVVPADTPVTIDLTPTVKRNRD